MKRSDSTMLPSGASTRTGPCTIIGPPSVSRTVRTSSPVGTDHHQLLFAAPHWQPAGPPQPLRARGHHRTERNALAGNHSRDEAGLGKGGQRLVGSGELRLNEQ